MWALASLLLLALIAFNLLVVWVATGPRHLTQYAPFFEEQFAAAQDRFHMKVENILLIWDGWQHPVDIRLKNVKLYTKQNLLFANFPDISVGIDLTALVQGKVMPNSIALYRPVINLYRRNDGEITLDFGENAPQGPYLPKAESASPGKPISVMLADAGIAGLFEYLNRFRITDATVRIGNTTRGVLLTASGVELDAHYLLGDIDATLSGKLQQQEADVAGLYVQAGIPLKDLGATFKVTMDNFQPATLAPLLPMIEGMNGVKVPLNGWLSGRMTDAGSLAEFSYKLFAGKGVVDIPLLMQPLPVTSARVEGELNEGIQWRVKQFDLDSEGRQFSGNGSFWQDGQRRTGIMLHAEGKHLQAGDVQYFWPPSLSPISREWVVESVLEGDVSHAAVDVKIQPGDLERERLPDEAINADIHFTSGRVRYDPGYPELTGASGIAHFNANQMKVTVEKASTMTGTVATKGVVAIDDLMLDNPRIEVEMDVAAPAADIAHFMALPDIDVAGDVNMNEKTISGSAKGKVKLAFDFYAPRDANGNIITDEAVDYQIKAELADVLQPGLLGKYDISDASGTIGVTNEKLAYLGKANVFGRPAELDVLHEFHPKEGAADTVLTAKMTVTPEVLGKLGVPLDDYMDGVAAVAVKLELYAAKEVAEVDADLKDAAISIADLKWQKLTGVPASLKLKATVTEDQAALEQVHFQSGNEQFEGDALLDADGSLQSVQASVLRLGGSDMALDYARISGGYKFHANGKRLDVSPWLEGEGEEQRFTQKELPALDVRLDMESFVLGEGKAFNNMTGYLQCNPDICIGMKLGGKLASGKPFTASITPAGRTRHVLVNTEDAGALLHALDIYNEMEGGRLHLEADFDDSVPEHPLKGGVNIWKFRIKNAPALTRLLTLASFTGVKDILQGNGVSFEKMKADFTLAKDVITVHQMKNVGSSLGITAEGIIRLDNSTLKMKGTVVPSYTINSFLKNVPLVGQLLTGGEAIIAALYTMEGPLDDPKISVNPLSMLAPGFLRGLFETEDIKAPKGTGGE